MISSAVFVTLLLASAVVQAQPPIQAVFGVSTAVPLASRASGWWFFDVTVASTSPIKVTRIGGRTPYGATVGDTGTVTDMQIFKRTGTSRNNERNPSAGWVQVNSPTDNYDWEVITVGGANFVVVDIDDFVLSGSGANGIAVHLPDDFGGVGDVQIVYDGDVVTPTTPYIYPVMAATPLVTVSTATTTTTFDANSLVQGYHAPNLFLEFTDPDAITIAATNPLNVCAGDGTLVNFTATVTNTGFTALEPIIITDTLTTPNNDTQYLSGITRAAVAITGCSWKIQEYTTASAGTTLQDAEDVIAASDPVPVLKPIVKARADSTHGEAGDLVNSTATVVTDWTGEGANHVVQLRTSVSFATGGPYQLGFVSADFEPGTSIWFFIDNSATPLTFTAANSFIIDPALTDLDIFYTSDTNPINGNGNAYNIRVVINMPTPGTDGHYDLEIYARDTSVSGHIANSGEDLDQAWFPLQASQATPNPDVTITPNSNDLAATWTIPSLCVGGQIRLTTQLLVDSSAPDDLTVTDVFHVDTTQPSGSSAIITPASATVSPTLDVDRCSELTITKTTLCDRTELSQWQVEFWQSDAQTVGNGTSPFYDFDTTIASSTPTNTLNVDKVDFGNANSGAFDTDGDETTFEEISGNSMVAASQFFVRARGQIVIDPAGFYTFYVASNRGVRLTIDGKNASILEEPFGVAIGQDAFYENFYTASLTAGVHNVEIVMYDTVPNSILELAIAAGAEPLQSASFNGFANTPSINDGTEELSYDLLATAPVCLLACDDDFFSGFTVNMWQWNALVNVAFENSSTLIEAASPFDQFDSTIQFLTPDASACGVQYINFQSDDGSTVSGGNTENVFGDDEFYPLESVTTPINNFFFRATGRFFIGVTGTYTISVNSNRGARITIDGVVRIRNEPESNGDFQRFVSLPFTAGEHTIIVDHYDSLNVARLEVGIAAGAVTSINSNDPFNDGYLSFTLLGSALECQLEPQFDALETVVAGQNFTYTVTVNNNGPSDADVTVADVVGPTVVPWIVAFRTEDAGDTVTNVTATMTPTDYAWTTTIPAGEARRLFIDVAVPASVAAIDNGPMNTLGACNSATATASAGQIGTATVTTCATIIRLVDLETSIVFSDAEVTANDAADTLTATVTITNNGPSDTAGGSVPLTIVTPAGVTFTTSGNATLSAGVLTVGALPSGSTVVLTITFDATAATAVGPITIASGDFTLTNAALERLIRTCNDEQNAAAAVIRQIDLELSKVAVTSNADTTNAVAGQDTITYTITASNNGPSTLPAGARIIDTFYGDTTGLSVNSGLTTFTPALGSSYVTTLCGAVDTTKWSIQYWNVADNVANNGEFPFADIDRIHADNVAPTFEEERDVLSIAANANDVVTGFGWTRWPTAAQTGSVNFNNAETFFATATTQLDVRSAGHFTFAANVRTGIRLSITGGSTSTKIVLQPATGLHEVFHTLALAVGVYDITVDYYFLTASTEQVLQFFIADGSRFTYPAALDTITPEFYRLLTPADCEYACDLAPDSDAIDTEWRTRFWAFNDSSVDNATSVFERLDQIIGANAVPLVTAQTATANFVRPQNMIWGEPAPLAGSFFSRSVGQIWIAEAGIYAFKTQRPAVNLAGSRLFVDGNVLTAEVNENQALDTNYYAIELAQGAHDVVFDAAVPCLLNTGNCREIDLEIARMQPTDSLTSVTSLSYENLRTSTYCQVDYWVLPEIAAGDSATLVLVIDVGSSAVAQAALGDTVHYPRLELPAENQLISENDDLASASVSISREVSLSIDVVATPQEVVAGAAGTADEVLFAVTLANAGPSDTAGVKVRVTFPSTATVTGPTFDDATDVTSSVNATTLVWTTKVIAAGATDVLELRFTFGPQASCDVDFDVRVEIIELVDAVGETLVNALPIEDIVSVNVIRRGTLVLSLVNNVAAVSASDDASQCSTYTASVQNTGPSYVSDATAQLALTLPLGAYVTAVSTAVRSSGPGSLLNVALPTLVPNAMATEFTFDLCASSETPDAAVIDATLSVVLLPDNLCEELTQTPADARNVVVTREAARLAVNKVRADPGHIVGTEEFAIAGEYAGNAPFIIELSNAAVESDVDGITVESSTSTTEVVSELHRVVLQPLDVGWTVEAFLPGQTDAGDLTTFPVDAPFVTFIADSLDYSGAVPAELAAAATTANGFYLRASAPIVIQSDAARVYTVTSTGDVELTIDGNVVVNGQSLALTTGVHQAVVRVAQAADLAAFNLHVRAASAPLLGEDLATFQAGTPSTWTIPTLRAGRTARLYEFFSALSVITGDTGKLKNTATVNEPTSPATLNGDAGDKHVDAAQHNVHQYCVRGVDVVLEVTSEASVAYAGDNDFQHYVRVTNQGFVQCTAVTVTITATSSNADARAIMLVSPQTVSLASGQSIVLPVHYQIDGDADATGTLTTTAQFVAPLHAFTANGERPAVNTPVSIVTPTPIDRLSLVNIAVVRTTNTQSDDVANNGGANPAITYDVTFTNNGPSPARYPLVIFRCPTATPTNLNTECEKIRVNRRADADKLLTVGESRTVAVEIAASDIGVGGSIFRSFFFAPKSIDGLDGTIEYSPVPIQVDTNVAPFTIGLEITAFEEIEKKRNVDAWASSSSSSESSSSSSSSSSSDDTETRLIFVEVHNLNAIVNGENVAVLIQFGAHDKIEHAEALLTQSSRHDSVVNNGGPSFTWTIGELAHGARARIALKLRASSHLSLSAEIVAANACLATSATCEIAADLSIENPFTKLF